MHYIAPPSPFFLSTTRFCFRILESLLSSDVDVIACCGIVGSKEFNLLRFAFGLLEIRHYALW
ncbi:hypothetical protein Fmac_003047 [Flemingia macrophylla]|uniref:Uncharacterized protein n=1 Tax=Flemingia macrophylla TaxID=520843 RepID=A0ABD1NLN4_9FABA